MPIEYAVTDDHLLLVRRDLQPTITTIYNDNPRRARTP